MVARQYTVPCLDRRFVFDFRSESNGSVALGACEVLPDGSLRELGPRTRLDRTRLLQVGHGWARELGDGRGGRYLLFSQEGVIMLRYHRPGGGGSCEARTSGDTYMRRIHALGGPTFF